MSTPEPRIDPCITPVWAVYGNDEETRIIHAPLDSVPYGRRRVGPVPETAMWGDGGIWTHRSGWYETEAALIAAEGLKPSCSCCGNPFSTANWCEPYPEQLTERNLCFTCNHWIHTVIPRKDEPGQVRVKHHCYSFNVDRPIVKDQGQFLGFGGAEWAIRFHDGRTYKTNNLWHGGEIPKRFRDQLPDNAVFEPKDAGFEPHR